LSTYLRSAELYDPATGGWTGTGSMAIARGLHAATLLPDGQLLVAGGFGGPESNVALDSAERYDPVTGVWSSAGNMALARLYHTATLLPDGTALIAGGRGGDSFSLASAELYTGIEDESPPVTTATVVPAPNAAGWNRVPVTVTLQAVDEPGGSGIASVTYRATGAQQIPTTTVAGARVTITFGAQGVTTLSYFARDRAGNLEATKTRVVRIDRTAPTLRVADLTVPATSAAGAIVRSYPVSATDNLDPSPVIQCLPPAPHLFPINPLGAASTVGCTVTDRAGNAASRSFRIHVAGAAEQIVALRALLARMVPSPRVTRRLDRDLAKALRALQHAKPQRACAHLGTFARHVDRYRHDGTLTAVQAARLTADASRIASVVDCRSIDDDRDTG
jgi:hypothetical protein